MAFAPDCRNTNSFWCSVLVETLARLGVRQAVCSPGSRSTPLTLALAGHPQIEAIPVLDERSAGFFALGLAKRTGMPAVLVCTSGSAAANYLPAVVEAHEAGIPLLVFTADRPPEMRSCTSGQTIDQQKLFGHYVVHYHEVAVPEATLPRLNYLRQTIATGFRLATGDRSGPVHFNCPFRDPLVPTPEPGFEVPSVDEAFFSHLSDEVTVVPASVEVRWPTERGLIVAGNDQRADDSSYLEAVARLARTLQWPVLAEAISPARRLAKEGVTVVTAYDTILRNLRLASELQPARVVCLGQWPTSKVLRAWLEAARVETLLVSPAAENRDALHGRTVQLPFRAEQVQAAPTGAQRSGFYAGLWAKAESAARAGLERGIQESDTLVEPQVLAMVAKATTPGDLVMVGNSMPVRDSEYFWPHRPEGARVWCNRGANGIDGNLSTALGLAQAGGPVHLVLGDLAFLHDSNAFLSVPQFRGSLTVVVVNNRGGGIFEHLPVAQYDPPFEKYFATPQAADLGLLCRAHGVPHQRVSDREALAAALQSPHAAGVRVIEVITDRKRDAAWRKALFASVASSLA